MSQWGKNDVASNSVIWAPTSVRQAPTRANANTLFGNTSANGYGTGETIGMYGVEPSEQTAETASGAGAPAHAGWVLRTEGSGGRAGRVTYETLVAMGSMTGDAEDTVFEDYFVSFTTQPVATSANSSNNEQGVFTVVAATTPAGGTLAYQWQGNSTGSFANLSGTGVTGPTTNTLTLNANVITQQHVRVLVTSGGDTATSSPVLFTVTS